MVLFLILFGMFVGWSTSSDDAKPTTKLFQALVAGLTLGVVLGLFDLILNQLIVTGTDVRKYLAALAPESIRLFLFDQGAISPLLHLGCLLLRVYWEV
jgi:hypothetical protein